MILYLHGFHSSPQSFKARLLAERMQQLGRADDYLCPQLPASPASATGLAQDCIKQCRPGDLILIGSSLNDYCDTWLVEQIGCREGLLNPIVRPPRDLKKYVGVSTQYHSEQSLEFKREYIAELQILQIDRIRQPERYFLIAVTGDEVLDWREMVDHYPQDRQVMIGGSDHGIGEFTDYADAVLAFCGTLLNVNAAGSGL